MMDGTGRLCMLLYSRDARPRDYLGGSNARMLHDAANKIERLRAVSNFADHTRFCASMIDMSEPCDCGYDKARAALAGEG